MTPEIGMKTPPKKLTKWLAMMAEIYGPLMTMDGYDHCIAGVCFLAGHEPVLIYDRAKVIATLVAGGMTEEDAEEFHAFKQAGAFMGPRTPAFLEVPEL